MHEVNYNPESYVPAQYNNVQILVSVACPHISEISGCVHEMSSVEETCERKK